MLGTDEPAGTGTDGYEVVNLVRLGGVGVVPRGDLIEEDGVGFIQGPNCQCLASFDGLGRVAIFGR